MNHMQTRLEFGEFSRRVLESVEVNWADPIPTTDLFRDIGLDSLQAVEVLLVVESLANLEEPLLDDADIFTLGDAFAYYERALASSKRVGLA